MAPRPSQGGPLLGHGPRPNVPTLHKAPLPLEQLTQLQRRLAHCLSSLTELQEHVGNAQTLDQWPSLLNRHLTLVSQTHSLSQFLSLAAPNALNARLARRDEILLEDAQQQNKFSSGGGGDAGPDDEGQSAARSHDALFVGSSEAVEKRGAGEGTLSLPVVRYSDGDENPLAKVAAHPFHPLDAEKAQTVIPSLLLPRGIDNSVAEDAEKRWQGWLERNAAGQDPGTDAEKLRECVRICRAQMAQHDAFAARALRSWVHAQEATDELGQRYDWRMRLSLEEEEDDEAQEQDDGPELRKRKRDSEDDGKELSIDEVRRLLRGAG